MLQPPKYSDPEGQSQLGKPLSDFIGVTEKAAARRRTFPVSNMVQEKQARDEVRKRARLRIRGQFGSQPTWDKHVAARKARNARDYRARLRAEREAEHAPLIAALEDLDLAPRAIVSRDVIGREVWQLKVWLALPGQRQRQLRPRAKEIMRSRIELLRARNEIGIDPGYGNFARRLSGALGRPVTKDAARNTLRRLLSLELSDGPWPGDG